MLFIKYVLRIPLRMTDEACKIGDYAVHAEESYTFAYYNRSLLNRRQSTSGDHELEGGIHGLIMGRAAPDAPKHTGSIVGVPVGGSSEGGGSAISPAPADDAHKYPEMDKKEA